MKLQNTQIISKEHAIGSDTNQNTQRFKTEVAIQSVTQSVGSGPEYGANQDTAAKLLKGDQEGQTLPMTLLAGYGLNSSKHSRKNSVEKVVAELSIEPSQCQSHTVTQTQTRGTISPPINQLKEESTSKPPTVKSIKEDDTPYESEKKAPKKPCKNCGHQNSEAEQSTRDKANQYLPATDKLAINRYDSHNHLEGSTMGENPGAVIITQDSVGTFKNNDQLDTAHFNSEQMIKDLSKAQSIPILKETDNDYMDEFDKSRMKIQNHFKNRKNSQNDSI